MDAKKLNKKDRANLERYAEIIRAEIVRMEESDNRRYRTGDYDEWIAQRRQQLETIARALEEGRAPSTPCTAWDALEAREEHMRAEKAAEAARQGLYIPDDLYTAERDADDAWRALGGVALRQAGALALEALAADPEPWTKRPAHYKATAEAVREITDAALIATGCKARLYCGYSWDYPRLSISVDAPIWRYLGPKDFEISLTAEAGHLAPERMDRYEGEAWRAWTPARVRAAAKAYRADVAKALEKAEAYKAAARALQDKYRPMDLRDDLDRALKVTI